MADRKSTENKKSDDEKKLDEMSAREKSLSVALAEIEKKFGKGAVMKFGTKVEAGDMDIVPTGILSIDVALGIGGMPRGRIIEVYGPEASGKTTITLYIIAEVQKLGGIAAFIDAEHALDPTYAKKLGVNIDEMYISQPDDGEQALEITEAMVRSGAIDIIVIDSVAALVPKAEIDGNMGDSHMGLHARLMSQALRKLTAFVSKSNCMIVFTNQLREKIGSGYGGPSETTTGGRALRFYSSVRLDIRKTSEAIKVNSEIVGYKTKVKVAKNKLAPPFKQVEFDLIFGQGVPKAGVMLDLGSDIGVINKSGSWYYYKEAKLGGQGRETAKRYLEDNPNLMKEIENAIRSHYGFKTLEEIHLDKNPITLKGDNKDSKKSSSKSKDKSKSKKGQTDPQEDEFDMEVPDDLDDMYMPDEFVDEIANEFAE